MMSTSMRLVRSAALLLLTVGFTATASAQATAAGAGAERDVRRARALFAEGLSFVDRRDFASAEDRFRRCLALRSSPVVEYNLASVLAEQGEVTEAAELLRGLVERDDVSARLRRAGAIRLERIERRTARVRLSLRGASESAVVTIDGRSIPDAAAPILVDPGRHEIAARDRRSAAGVTIDVAAGATADVVLALGAVPDDAPAAAPRERPERRPASAKRRRRVLFTTLGATAFGAIAASVLLTRDGRNDASREVEAGLATVRFGR